MSSPGAVIAGAAVVMEDVHSSLTSPERLLVSLTVVIVVLIMWYIILKFFDD